MTPLVRLVGLVACFTLGLCASGSAANAPPDTASGANTQNMPPQFLGYFGHWQAYHFEEDGQPVCYMVTSHYFASSKKFKRGTAYLMVTHRPQENNTDVVSYSPGYAFATKHDVTLSIGKASYSLFTSKDAAWTHNAAADHKIAAALRSAKDITLRGVPAQKGVPALTDTLNVTGAAEAYQAIGKACGLTADKPEPPKKPAQKPPARKKTAQKHAS